MPRTRLRHFFLHSILFHIFLGVAITIALIYLFDKETGVGGGQTGGRLEPIIVSVIDESDMSDSLSNEAEQAPQPDEEKEDSSEESVILEKIPERTEEAIKKEPEIETVSAPKKPAEQSEKKKPVDNTESKPDSNIAATSEAGETSSPAEGDDAEREAQKETTGELAYNLSEGAKPNYGINPKPPYPKSARRRGQEGTVLLRVLVLQDGKVGEIELAGPSGYSVLDESALKAVKDWIFVPGKKGGVDISSWVEVPIKFQLDSG